MIAMEAIKEIMKIKGIRPSMLSDRLKIKSNVLSGRFRQKNVSVSKLDEIVRMMEYKVVLVPKETRMPDGSFEIE